MRLEHIRPIAICVCQQGGKILVAEGRDSRKGETFYRPLGGTIEFGERGEDTVRREFREEIHADLLDVRFLGTLENIFTWEGMRGHEIVLVYDGTLADQTLLDARVITGDEMGHTFKAIWMRLDDFKPGAPPVYPDGLLDLLSSIKKDA
jgi:ADP-ribose pyrophosphatase YjhB (NUDIX family)